MQLELTYLLTSQYSETLDLAVPLLDAMVLLVIFYTDNFITITLCSIIFALTAHNKK